MSSVNESAAASGAARESMNRAGRYDRKSDDVLTLTGQAPQSVQELVRKNAAIFTASDKVARASVDARG